MTAPKLKPCPFCGGEADIWRAHERRTAWIACMGKCVVLISKEYLSDDEAIAAWNRRADIAAVQPAQVRVKPLVWETFGKECLRAETVLGRYEVMWGFHNGQTSLDIPAPRRNHVWHQTIDAAKAAAQADYEARILAALEPQPDHTVEIDLRAAMMEELEKAASESPWVPEEYYMNEVISDCCAFLRSDRPQPDPRDEVIKGLVEALVISANRLDWCAVDYETGSRKFIVTSEWADEARAALAAAKAVQHD